MTDTLAAQIEARAEAMFEDEWRKLPDGTHAYLRARSAGINAIVTALRQAEGRCTASPDHADILETIENAADDWQKNGYTSALAEVRDMANVGRSLMEALPKGYCYMDSPAEIVVDLQNERDDALALRQAEAAPGVEIVAQDRGDWQTVSLQAEIEKGIGVEQWIAQNKPPQAEAAPGVVEVLCKALERCSIIVERHNFRQAEKVEDVKHVAREALALARQHGAREGYVMVPREPTEAMYEAGYDATRLPDGTPQFADAGYCLGHSGNIYRAMIAAAPATDVGEK